MTRTLLAGLALALLMLAAAPAGAAAATSATGATAAPALNEQDAPPGEEWNRTYGGGGTDYFSSVTPTEDGGYLLTGWSEPNESADAWAVKIDGQGEVEWERTFGGSGTDWFYDAVPTEDGGYLLAGRTDDDGTQGWAVKVGGDGTEQWNRTYGAGSFWAVERADGAYLLAGWTRGDGRDGWGVVVDAGGEPRLERTYSVESGADETVKDVVPSDDGYIFAGVSEQGETAKAFAAKVNTDGSVAWNRTYGDADWTDVWAGAATDDGGAVLAGETGTADTEGRDALVLRVDSNGEVAWRTTHGGEAYDWVDSATATEDGGYLVTGGTQSGDIGGADGLVLKYSSDGELAWETVVGSPSWDKIWPTANAHDGGYLLAGATNGHGADGRDGYVVKLGAGGANGSDGTDGSSDGPSAGETTDDTDGNGGVDGGMNTGGQPGFTAGLALAALACAALLGWLSRKNE